MGRLTLKRLSEGVFLRVGFSEGEAPAPGAPVFSCTLPWLSLRNGGGSHFRLEAKKKKNRI